MRSYYTIILTLLTAILLSCKPAVSAQTNQDKPGTNITLADPAILYYKGVYYLYGTGGNRGTNQGFVVYQSKDLKTWQGPKGVKNGYALAKGDAFGERNFWAPQVFHHKNKFYLAYAADEQIAIAESDSPLGPFTQREKKALPSLTKQIDPFIFIDEDGKIYLYYVQVADGGNRMFVVQMQDDFSAVKPETKKLCIQATEPWENTKNALWSVTEGPSVLKYKGRYYFIYSANHFENKDYAVGYAVSNTPFGPWEKFSSNPIISKSLVNQSGTGHGDFTKDKKGNLVYVFHTHQSETAIGPRKTAIIRMQFSKDEERNYKLEATKKSFYFLKKAD